ncbi:MAG: helix-turn-helix domain-containing protein [Flavobacteriaceae bacterium]|nr:helix-turn-helix domain-containing protein [Flavobacteriaceae bacterium]
MINNSDFSKRLKKILSYYQLSASSFADKIGVQRSSISHLLSGRNKPSLDFVLKTVKEFEEVELYWLLNGKGNFPFDRSIQSPILTKKPKIDTKSIKRPEIGSETAYADVTDKIIERIVIFYTDGSFKAYTQPK